MLLLCKTEIKRQTTSRPRHLKYTVVIRVNHTKVNLCKPLFKGTLYVLSDENRSNNVEEFAMCCSMNINWNYINMGILTTTLKM